jgi:hypothetical protein
MILKNFRYSVLKYRPSLFLQEELNVGLLFHFIEDEKTTFIFPNKLQRVKSFYPKADLHLIKAYLKSFEKQANKIDKASIAIEFDKSFLSNFLLEDSGNLYFSDIQEGRYTSVKQTIDYYQEAYFHVYESVKLRTRKDEAYLKSRFSNFLNEFEASKQLFRKDFEVKGKTVSTKFDFAWQNGSTNLVKLISFDFLDSESIKAKSFRWQGELNEIAKEAFTNNDRLNLLLVKPQTPNLFKHYDKAVKRLEGIDAQKEIIEDENLSNYLTNAVQNAKAFPNHLQNG